MPDILDAAQKQINDAASALTPPAAAAAPPASPPEPTPEPAKPPEPVASEPTPEESAFVDKLIHETTSSSASAAPEPPTPPPPAPEPVAPPPEEKPTPPPAAPKKKGTGRGAMIAAILLLLITLPLGVFFVSQQQQLAEVRSRAAETCQPADDCSDNGRSCAYCPGTSYRASNRSCCKTVTVPASTPVAPTPPRATSTPPPTSQPTAAPRSVPTPTNSAGTGGPTGSGTGGGSTSAPPSAQLTPIPDTFQGGEGSCSPGANTPDHIYNLCCGEGLSKRVIRSCTNAGKFVYAVGACDQPDNACKTSAGGSTVCPNKEDVYVNGQCYKANAGGCIPNCRDKTCGANDGCSGVCTESCTTQAEADRVSARGPTGGIINAGNARSNVCNNSTGVCQAGSGQTLTMCSCSVPSVGPQAAQCRENCQTVPSGTASCQVEADRLCKTIQLDVCKSGTSCIGPDQVDTFVCGPSNSSACGAGAPPPQAEQPAAAPTPIPTPVVGPQCRNIKLYKNNEVVQPSTLVPGDQIVIAVVGSNATKARFRVNGGTFTESTGTNAAGEFTLSFTIPASVPNNSITIEAEVFQNGVWR